MRLMLLIAFAACGTREAAAPAPSTDDEHRAGGAVAERPGTVAPTLAPDPSPEPNIELAIEPQGGAVALSVRVLGPAANLRRAVRVEKQTAGEWVAVDSTFALRASCDAPSEGCIELAAGAELAPPHDGPCASAPLEAGRYRFVVESCAPPGTRPHKRSAEVSIASAP